ncbi:hypothetical protein AMATHDRAFT_99276, partial [Amanita thiersii Skay4041]
RGGHLEYLVKWLGYPMEECTWQPSLLNKSFHEKHPAAPHPIALRQFEFKHYENHTEPRTPRKLFSWEDGKF